MNKFILFDIQNLIDLNFQSYFHHLSFSKENYMDIYGLHLTMGNSLNVTRRNLYRQLC